MEDNYQEIMTTSIYKLEECSFTITQEELCIT